MATVLTRDNNNFHRSGRYLLYKPKLDDYYYNLKRIDDEYAQTEKDYKEYKVKSIAQLIKNISESNLEYLQEVEKYNNLSQKELDRILNKSLIEVTSLPINTYI